MMTASGRRAAVRDRKWPVYPGDYHWSSYRAHAFGVEPGLWSPHPLHLQLGSNKRSRQEYYRALMCEQPDVDVLAKIRHCANKGLILGTETFREQFHALTGDRTTTSG